MPSSRPTRSKQRSKELPDNSKSKFTLQSFVRAFPSAPELTYFQPGLLGLFFYCNLGDLNRAAIQLCSREVAQTYRHDTQNHGGDHINRGTPHCSAPHEIECLQAEGRESCESSAESNHNEKPDILGYREASVSQGECSEEPDQKRS